MGGHSEQYFRNLVENIDISIAEHRLIYNKEGQAIDYEFLYVNEAFCRDLKLSFEEIVGQRVKVLIPSIEEEWIDRYAKVVDRQRSNHFMMYSNVYKTYFNVHAFPTGKDTFVTYFRDVGSMPSYSKSEENKANFASVALMEYNRILKHITTNNNIEELIGQDIQSFDEYQMFIQKNIHPEDLSKIIELDREIRGLTESKKVIVVRVYHQKLQRYAWIEFTIFVKEFSGEIPEVITVFGQNKDYEYAQKEAKENLTKLFEETKKVANIATFLYQTDTQTFQASSELNAFLGVANVHSIEDFREIVHADDLARFDDATEAIIQHPEGRINRYRISKYGEVRHLESYLYGQQNEYGETVQVFGILIDRTKEVRQNEVTENARNSFERVFNLAPSGMFAVDQDFEITLKNDKFKEYLEQEKLYNHLSDLFGNETDTYTQMLQENRELKQIQIEVASFQQIYYYNVSLTRIEGNFRNKYLGTIVDVTEMTRKTKEIEYLSNHDMLTKLYNRHAFDERILAIDEAGNHGIIVCDIDGLKLMNDAFGHLDGDKLLVGFANKLTDIIKDGMIARIGGDEFGVIIENTSNKELDRIGSEIAKANQEIGLYEVDFSVSIGYSLVHENQSFLDAFKEAENRMYRMKLKQRSNRKSKALDAILSALDKRSIYHKPHREQVAKYARAIMQYAGYKRTRDLDEIEQVGLLHDVGKIVVSETILQKPQSLSKQEMKSVEYHAESGYKIISNIVDNDMIALSVLYHHENYDGSGYPHGIKDNQIPLYSRVIRIADSYDIMVSEDGYKEVKSPEEAVQELIDLKGIWYDPNLVDAFVKYLKEEGTI